jgi:hypothetical protein
MIDSYSAQKLAAEANKITSAIDMKIGENGEIHKAVKALIDKIKHEVDSEEKTAQQQKEMLEAKKGADREEYQEPPELRMKKQISGTLIVHFQDVLKETNKVQSDYKKAVQANIKEQLRLGISIENIQCSISTVNRRRPRSKST